MPKRILSIIESAYRATLEEQDDTIIWLAYTLKGAGANLDVLLRGNAVNYAVSGQNASGLSFGERRQTQPPQVDEDLLKLVGKGMLVFAVAEDLAERGIEASEMVSGVKMIPQSGLARLLESYDQVWHW
jgi:sulfur transfer complex TusBCD TusB component (DsrH family)